MTREELAERLEGAECGSRELSDEVLLACGWKVRREWNGFRWQRQDGYVADRMAPTTSIDNALALVPEGWFWRVGHSTLYAGWAGLNRLHPDHCNREDEAFASAATPALALCAAVLRAQAQEKDRE